MIYTKMLPTPLCVWEGLCCHLLCLCQQLFAICQAINETLRDA